MASHFKTNTKRSNFLFLKKEEIERKGEKEEKKGQEREKQRQTGRERPSEPGSNLRQAELEDENIQREF